MEKRKREQRPSFQQAGAVEGSLAAAHLSLQILFSPKTQPTLSSTRPTWQRWTHPSAGETVAFTTFLLPLLLCFTRSPWPPWPSQLASPSYKTSSPRPRVPPPPSFPLRAAATGKGHPRTCFPASRSHGRLGHDLAAGLSLRRGLPFVVFSLENTAPDPF